MVYFQEEISKKSELEIVLLRFLSGICTKWGGKLKVKQTKSVPSFMEASHLVNKLKVEGAL